MDIIYIFIHSPFAQNGRSRQQCRQCCQRHHTVAGRNRPPVLTDAQNKQITPFMQDVFENLGGFSKENRSNVNALKSIVRKMILATLNVTLPRPFYINHLSNASGERIVVIRDAKSNDYKYALDTSYVLPEKSVTPWPEETGRPVIVDLSDEQNERIAPFMKNVFEGIGGFSEKNRANVNALKSIVRTLIFETLDVTLPRRFYINHEDWDDLDMEGASLGESIGKRITVSHDADSDDYAYALDTSYVSPWNDPDVE